MSRAIHLDMNENQAREQCDTRHIGVSSIEALPDGGVRLVCMSAEGAAMIRRRCKSALIKGPVRRKAHGMARSPIEGWVT